MIGPKEYTLKCNISNHVSLNAGLKTKPKMKYIKPILDRPYLIIVITAIIALLSPDSYILFSFPLICSIFIISIIYTIIQKKWLRLILSIVGYFIFIVFWIGLILLKVFVNDKGSNTTIGDLMPQKEIGNSNFYSNEIRQSPNINIPEELTLISKLDTIVYSGIEREYDAECLYTGPKQSIIELEKKITSNKNFSKVNELVNYPTKVLTHDNFKLNELKSVYKKESEGHHVIYIAISKNDSKLYYKAVYY